MKSYIGWPRSVRCFAKKNGQGGLALVGAIVGVALLVGLGLLMMSLTIEFHRIRNESLSGTQFNFIADVLLMQYWREGQTGVQESRFNVTTEGIFKVNETDTGQGPPRGWMDTIHVLVWSEEISTGRRLWAMIRSERSRRSASAVRFVQRQQSQPNPNPPPPGVNP